MQIGAKKTSSVSHTLDSFPIGEAKRRRNRKDCPVWKAKGADMPIYYDPNNKVLAQKLRKNMTQQERHLWYDFLSGYPIRFRRQKQFGKYIVDFYCGSAKLVVELDGGQHYTEQMEKYDRERTAYLESIGLTVVRFTNLDIDKNFRGVCERIEALVKAFPYGEGGTAEP